MRLKTWTPPLPPPNVTYRPGTEIKYNSRHVPVCSNVSLMGARLSPLKASGNDCFNRPKPDEKHQRISFWAWHPHPLLPPFSNFCRFSYFFSLLFFLVSPIDSNSAKSQQTTGFWWLLPLCCNRFRFEMAGLVSCNISKLTDFLLNESQRNNVDQLQQWLTDSLVTIHYIDYILDLNN